MRPFTAVCVLLSQETCVAHSFLSGGGYGCGDPWNGLAPGSCPGATDEPLPPKCDGEGRPHADRYGAVARSYFCSPEDWGDTVFCSCVRNGFKRSMGTGNMIVEFFSVAISVSVWRNLN